MVLLNESIIALVRYKNREGSMKDKAQRVGMGVLALLFIAITIGTVVYSIWQNNKTKRDAASLNETVKNRELTMLKTTDINQLTPTTQRITELIVVDLIPGTGDTVVANADVSVHYTGALVKTGKVFQSSTEFGTEPISFNLNGVIKGWTNGLVGMKVGGTRRLIIPAAQAYGNNSPSASIPNDSDLIFDIELIGIGKQ